MFGLNIIYFIICLNLAIPYINVAPEITRVKPFITFNVDTFLLDNADSFINFNE